MHQRGDMNQFHDYAKIDMARSNFTGGPTREKRQQRAKSFTAPTDRVGNITFNRRIERRRLLHDPRFDRVELRLNELGHPGQCI